MSVGPRIAPLAPALARRLERHQARAYATGARQFMELGDAFLLHDERTTEPAFNRLGGILWPEANQAFDRRLAEVLELFAQLERRPYAWLLDGVAVPADVAMRFEASGFTPGSGGYLMRLADGALSDASGVGRPPGLSLERLDTTGADRDGALADAATMMGLAFGVPDEAGRAIADDLGTALAAGGASVVLARLDGAPVGAGRRMAFEGAAYLSAIGVRPGFEGSGIGGAITTVLARDARASGVDHVYLAVDATNVRAWTLYERLGFEAIGGRAVDYLMP